MASYTIYVSARAGAKVTNADFYYPDLTTTTSGTGHAVSTPLDVIEGDTVTFKTRVDGGGSNISSSAFVSGLTIFTDNTDFMLVDYTSQSTTRTVATGVSTSTANAILVENDPGSASDNFYFLRQPTAGGPYNPPDPAVSRDRKSVV